MRYVVALYTTASTTVVIDAADEETAARQARDLLALDGPQDVAVVRAGLVARVDIESGDWRCSEVHPEAERKD